ncbi:MAG: PepSY-like domain-containing protein [Bacteroidales bacterium]|jgi:hypothetical protein|nr:PepSY-like domain-containing protein [Bacteroidales bacterium]
MKRITFLLAGLIMMASAAFADNDKPVTVKELPVDAQQFIEKYFPGAKVALAKEENERYYKSYEVIFADGSKIEFDGNGQWTEVDCRSTPVPSGIVPQQIVDYVTANYAGATISDIDRDTRDYEVSLSNRLELTFNLQFNLIDIDD